MDKEILFTERWGRYLKYFPESNRDIYLTEEYVGLYEDAENSPECFVYKDQDNIFLFIYLKRRVKLLKEDYFDFETPYGYSGPIANTGDASFIKEAFNQFYILAKKNKIIAGFIRFNPLLNNQIFLNDTRDEAIFDRKTVVMNLRLEPDIMWCEQIHTKHRNSIKKAQKMGLKYIVDESLKHLNEFVSMYKCAMDKVNASKFYYFAEDYFNNLRNLERCVFLGLVLCDDKIIAGALFFKYAIFGHYHLAASLEDYRHYAPNNFLIYETALYMKSIGIKLFHLGGGTDNNMDNSLYKFKKRFSKDEGSFYIGKLMINEEVYQEACTIWRRKFSDNKGDSNKFLMYRY